MAKTLFREMPTDRDLISCLVVSCLLFFSFFLLLSFQLSSLLAHSPLVYSLLFSSILELLWWGPAELNRLQHGCTTQWGPLFDFVFFLFFICQFLFLVFFFCLVDRSWSNLNFNHDNAQILGIIQVGRIIVFWFKISLPSVSLCALKEAVTYAKWASSWSLPSCASVNNHFPTCSFGLFLSPCESEILLTEFYCAFCLLPFFQYFHPLRHQPPICLLALTPVALRGFVAWRDVSPVLYLVLFIIRSSSGHRAQSFQNKLSWDPPNLNLCRRHEFKSL